MGVPENESADVGMEVSVGGNGEYVGNRMGAKVAVGVAICVSAFAVPTMSETVSMTCFGCISGVGRKRVQEVSSIKARRNDVIALLVLFIFPIPFYTLNYAQQFPFFPDLTGSGAAAAGGSVDLQSKREKLKTDKCWKAPRARSAVPSVQCTSVG